MSTKESLWVQLSYIYLIILDVFLTDNAVVISEVVTVAEDWVRHWGE